jgi:hypothetical protein
VYVITEGAPEGGNDPYESIYTSERVGCFHALPKHVRRLVGNIPELDLPDDVDCTEPTDLIIATYGSVLFEVPRQIRIYYRAYDPTMALHPI